MSIELRPADVVYADTASDTAIGELLLDIASGHSLDREVTDRLIELAKVFGAVNPPRTEPRFPIMVATDIDGVVAYTVNTEYAEHFAASLTQPATDMAELKARLDAMENVVDGLARDVQDIERGMARSEDLEALGRDLEARVTDLENDRR